VAPAFDPAATRTKYAEERSRRIGGNRSTIGQLWRDVHLSHFLDDPFTPREQRPPIVEDVDVAIIGAGIAGVVTGARLRGLGDFRIRLIDSAGGVGGTWYWNRYPGVMCDVESYIYMPMLEEMGYVPTRKYAFGEEIRTYIEGIARRYELERSALFHTRVEESRWNEEEARWIVGTDRGDVLRARFLVLAVGILNLVKLPDIPGFDLFEGHCFHASRWDYAYTGAAPGDPRLTRLGDRSIGLVGTGATAVQCLPPLAQSAREVYVFQRTPSAVGVRANRPTPEDFAHSLRPGWQKERMENFTAFMSGREKERDLVGDAWTEHMARVANPPRPPGAKPTEIAALAEEIDWAVMEEHRRRVAREVDDPEIAERLKPYYRYLCKRPLFHDEFLAAFNEPSVTLVDAPNGVTEVTPRGVVVDGREYPLDCIVFATGFEAEVTPLPRRAGHPIFGRGGRSMAEAWSEGTRTLHGVMSHGFPNLFLSPAPGQQAVISVNHTHIMVTGAEHIAATIAKLDAHGVRIAAVKESAENDWVERIESRFLDRTDFMSACTPSRLNFEGDPTQQNPRNGSFGGGYGDFAGWKKILEEWLAAEEFPGMEIER
jgi:cation diffusion facilitator CzcD-associated flavoprotein CzcO